MHKIQNFIRSRPQEIYTAVLPTTPYCKSIGRGHIRVSPAGLPIEQVLGEYSLSEASQRRSFTRFLQSPGWLLRSEARASDLFSDYPEYKTPTLSYETHPNYLSSDNYRPFEAVS